MKAGRAAIAMRERRTSDGGSADVNRPAFQVLDRTFSILDLFTEERPEWTTTEVARTLDLPVPTAFRILAALRDRGYVHQHPETKRFRLGIAALQLGERARAVVDLRSVALPVLRRISRETDEMTLLTVLSPAHDRSVCLERVETSQPLRLSLQPGRQLPLHAGASQKALLAFLPGEEAEPVLSAPLERLCTSTITDPQELRAELARIRRRGWASSFEETNVGVWGLAVPILDARRGTVGAIGLAGPSARLSPHMVAEHVRRLHAGAAEIARTLGLEVPGVRGLPGRRKDGRKGGKR
jgi:DNA-binding IclR family transcriptional regulator